MATVTSHGGKAISAAALVAFVISSGCGRRSRGPAGDPEDAVTGFFEAANHEDCDALVDGTRGPLREQLAQQGCPEYLAHFGGGPQLQLVEIVSTEQDGRDKDVFLVKFRFRTGDKERHVVGAVRAEDKRWVLLSF